MKTKRSRPPAAQVEIGRQYDLDAFSFVSRKYHTQGSVCGIQRQLVTLAQKVPFELEAHLDPEHNFSYQIWTTFDGEDPGKRIGYFNDSLNQDLFKILDRIAENPGGLRPPNVIRHFYLMGVTCFAVSEDAPRLTEIHEPYASTGVWLVPVVIGFPEVVFIPRNRRGRRR